MPFDANAAYAAAMSSGETASGPRPIEATGFCVRCTPSRLAMRHTLSGPASSVSCAKTVLSERSVACVTDVQPMYVWSYVATCHGLPASASPAHHGPLVHVNGAES